MAISPSVVIILLYESSIVGSYCSTNCPEIKRVTKADLPTPPSPNNTQRWR
eukprot:Awhi_evm1s11525